MAPTGEAYHIDWVWSNNSNVHVTNNLEWFSVYCPFKTKVSMGFGPQADIEGVGDVVLPVKIHRKHHGRNSHSRLTLSNVLYMPSATCNILGDLVRDGIGLRVDFGTDTGKLTKLDTGATVGLLDGGKLFRLRLNGQSPKQSSLAKDGVYMIRANWADSERQRWEAHTRQLIHELHDVDNVETPSQPKVPSYTTEEKQWLKENFKDEFHFLRMYGYSILDEEDRAEARQLGHDKDDESSDDDSTFLPELEEHSESHTADYKFSATELKWIKKHFGYSSNFLYSYGLQFYDDEDCKEGKAILSELMRDD
ncbi:hypothetical protein P7C71_g1082, partial [Lecanoromycetidae sp. Uapishka_2]